MRQGLLWLSERQGVFNFVRRNSLARGFASRFVAGETVDQGVEAARELSRRGITSSLDLLGESITAESEATAARDQYLLMLDRMAASGTEVNVSVKLTQMGLDISEALCVANMTAILEKAAALNGFVRLDMEGVGLHRANPRVLPSPSVRPFRRSLRRGDPVDAPPLREGHRGPHRHAGAGPSLQGRLPRAGRGGLPRQGGCRPELCPPDGAAARRGELSGHRHP